MLPLPGTKVKFFPSERGFFNWPIKKKKKKRRRKITLWTVVIFLFGPAFFLLAICNQNAILKIESARIIWFLKISIIRIQPKLLKNCQINVHGSSSM